MASKPRFGKLTMSFSIMIYCKYIRTSNYYNSMFIFLCLIVMHQYIKGTSLPVLAASRPKGALATPVFLQEVRELLQVFLAQHDWNGQWTNINAQRRIWGNPCIMH